MKYSRVSLFVLSVLLTSLCQPALAAAASPPLVITEVGAYEKSGTDALEWIEVYNRSTEPLDITAWKFLESSGSNLLTHGIFATDSGEKHVLPGSYAIIAQNDANLKTAYPEVTVPIFDSSWSTLSLDGETIGLKDALGTVTTLTYMASPETSVERLDVHNDQVSEENWRIAPYKNSLGKATEVSVTSEITEETPATPQEVVEMVVSTTSTPEVVVPIPEEVPVVTTVVTSTSTPPVVVETSTATTSTESVTIPEVTKEVATVTVQLVQPSPLRISELMPSPDQEAEWVEIYNTSSNAYDASVCALTDKTGNESLKHVLAPLSYTVVEVKNITLNNSGDDISLLCNDAVVDKVQYGTLEGVDKQTTAPAPKKGQALIRKTENAATSAELFGVGVATKGGVNNAVSSPTPTNSSSTTTVTSAPNTPVAIDVVINEVLSESSGDDSRAEFIELYNRGDFTTDLRGWSVSDGKTKFTLKDSQELRFPPGAYYVIGRTSSTMALGIKGSVKLTDPNSILVDETSFTDMEADVSWSRFGNDWAKTSLVTPSVVNTLVKPNHAPIARLTSVKSATVGTSVQFSSEDSTDQDGDVLQYVWDFGDGMKSQEANPTHTFAQSGKFPVVLSVTDGQRTATVQQVVTITKPVTVSTVATKPATTKRTKSTIVTYQYNPVELETIAELPHNTPVIVEGVIHYINKNSRIRSFYLGNPGIEVQLGSVLAEYLQTEQSVRVKALVSVSTSGARVLKVKDIAIIPALPAITPTKLPLSDAGLLETEYVETSGTVTAKKGFELTLEDETGTCKVTVPSVTAASVVIGDTVAIIGSSVKSTSACKIVVSKPAALTVLAQLPTEEKLSSYVPVTATGVSSVALAALWKKKSSLLTLITNIWKRNTNA